MNRSVAAHATALALALVAAFLVWTREPSADDDTIAVVSLSPLESATYRAPERKVELTRHRDDEGEYYWLEVETTRTPPAAAFAPPAAPPPAPAGAVPFPAPPAGRRPPLGWPPGAPGADRPGAPLPPGMRRPPPPQPAGARPLPPRAPAPAAAPTSAPPAPPPGALSPAGAPRGSLERTRPRQPRLGLREHEALWSAPSVAGPPPAPTPPAAPAPGGPAPALGGPQPQAAPRPQAAPVAPPPVAAVKTTRVFLGNDTATELMQTLSRLPAIRALGAVGQEKLAELGLNSTATTLTLRGGGATRTFVVGGRTYGNNDIYLLDQSDGHVYVVRPAPVQDLLNAEFRLADRQLHRFELADIDRVVIRAREGEQTLRQHEARVPDKAFWTVASAADQSRGKELVGNWISKLSRLQVLDYVGPDEPTDGQKERLRVEYFDGRKRLGFIEVLQRALLAPGTVASLPGGSYEYFARSEHTRRLIKLSRPLVEDLERDLAAVIREK